MTATIPNPTPADTLLGGRPLNLPLPDGSLQQVHVRQLPVKKLGLFLAAMSDPVALAGLYLGTDAGNLGAKDLAEVLRVGREVNADFFALSAVHLETMTAAGLIPGHTPQPASP